MDDENIPSRLKALREARGWSQYKLAEHIGCNQSTVHRIENGDRIPRGALKKMILLVIDSSTAGKPAGENERPAMAV
ncbi:helix-turn-helix domain-containing protein [Pelagibacterium luteolum]|uniref:Helix-turn-helix domain-containing protein n=1 Tax=Pelagibacterium luteolum TaxID=440168 RepID=A0A1G7ZH24_9HYPH|nr:helix-turn-helix transcriptional regulator [Pelagibacterium luteolum]SDH08091.1 Helix-turn-helix domain-containing protein [Pelagibacterium luteolum]